MTGEEGARAGPAPPGGARRATEGGPGEGPPGSTEALVERALAEDVGDGDRTTEWTVSEAARGRARVVAREAGVVAGLEPAELVFRRLDPRMALDWRVGEGDRVEPERTLLILEGRLRSILTGERTALNFLGRLSGIATLAARYVAAVRGTGCWIVDTRKTTPGWRALEKRAVAAGGATNHRMGLYDMVLIKENHAAAAGGLAAALEAVREPAAAEGIEVEVEVRSPEELEEALGGRPDRILLDNMSPSELRTAVERARATAGAAGQPPPRLEASGGITLESVRRVAETGVDLISVGAITHSAPALDLSLLVSP